MKKEKKAKKNDDFLAQEAKEDLANGGEYTLDIPDDEIWTYQIEGLQEPHIGKPYKNAFWKKVIVVIILLIAISASILLSFQAVHSDLYTYSELPDGTYKLERFSNPGDIREITIDYVVDLETGEKDYQKPITEIGEYAFNCDEVLNSITFGKDVNKIDGKSIYSCWWIQNVFIDGENPYYRDLDGVIYTKDLTEIIFYPNDHDKSLRFNAGYNVPTLTVDKNGNPVDKTRILSDTTVDDYLQIDENGFPLKDIDGNYLQPDKITENLLFEDDGRIMEELWGTTKSYNELYYQTYNRETRTYVIPSTVTKIGELAFAYSNIVDLYIPEGVKTMDNMAIFKNTVLTNIYSYKTDDIIVDTSYKAIDSMTEVYASLPEGLQYIGSDCMYYLRGLNYMYIPSSVTHISHHAFWDAVYKENKELKGVSVINVESSEEDFTANCETGNQWRPQYDYMLFKKSVDLNYGAARESQLLYNAHRQYHWAVQWIINNSSDAVKNGSSYLVKDMDADGVPELVLREFDESTSSTKDTVLSFNYGYLEVFDGTADYGNETFSKLEDNAMLDQILA